MEDTTPINDLDSSSLIRTERRWLRELSAFAQGTRSRMSSPPGETKKLGVFEVRSLSKANYFDGITISNFNAGHCRAFSVPWPCQCSALCCSFVSAMSLATPGYCSRCFNYLFRTPSLSVQFCRFVP